MRNRTPFCMLPLDLLGEMAERLKPPAFKMWLVAWAAAVECRCQRLPAGYDIKKWAAAAAIDVRTARIHAASLQQVCSKFATSLQQVCMVSISADERITVYGPAGYHKKLQGWKGNCGALTCPFGGQRVERVKEITNSNKNSIDRIETEPAKQGELPIPNFGVTLLGGSPNPTAMRARGVLLSKAARHIRHEALSVLTQATEGMTARQLQQVEQTMYAELLAFLVMLYHTSRARKPVAMLASFAAGSRHPEWTDEAVRWKEQQRIGRATG